MRSLLLALAGVIGLSAVSASAMTLSFDWGPTTRCFDPNSPPIHVGDVPKGTKRLSFVMHDLDAPNFHHGGGSVRYLGNASLDYGAFHYKGPCPPKQHTYRMTVTATDASGKVLAKAGAERKFPPSR